MDFVLLYYFFFLRQYTATESTTVLLYLTQNTEYLTMSTEGNISILTEIVTMLF